MLPADELATMGKNTKKFKDVACWWTGNNEKNTKNIQGRCLLNWQQWEKYKKYSGMLPADELATMEKNTKKYSGMLPADELATMEKIQKIFRDVACWWTGNNETLASQQNTCARAKVVKWRLHATRPNSRAALYLLRHEHHPRTVT